MMKFIKLIFFCFLITFSVVKTEDKEEHFQEEILKAVAINEKKCTTTAGELIFILDASTSVGPDDFNKEKDFATKIVERLSVGSNLTRVALITYNSFPSLVFNLHQFNSSKEINQQIMKAEFTEGITVVGDALNKVLTEIEPKTRPKIGKVIVLLSDGKRNGGMDPYLVAKQLKSSNYTIITIGLDKDSDEAAMKAISSNNMYYVIKNFDALDKIVTTIVTLSCITFHTAKCPKSEVKKDACVDQKQTVHVTAFYFLNGTCVPENRKLFINCLNPNECPKQYFKVALCSKDAKITHLLNVTYVRIGSQCAQKTIKLKEVACGCQPSIQEKTTVVFGKDCIDGFKKELILYNEFRQLSCQQSFFTISSVKCQELCKGNKRVSGACVNGTRTVKIFVKKFVNNKCDLVLESSSTSKCFTVCPKSVEITSKRCVNNTKTVTLVTFENVKMECIQKMKKLDSIKCTEGECPPTTMKRTKCIKGKQIIVKVMFTRVGKECKRSTMNVGLIQCIAKGCRNSTYAVAKCNKNDKTTFLIKTYFKNTNGTCIKNIKKVKELACKCYETTKGNITVTIGKTCEKGYRSRELLLQEERQGKCVDVKFTLRRIRCSKRCLRRRVTVTKCKDNKREVVKSSGKLINGKCEWKIEDKKVVKCNDLCPKSKQKTTRCVLGKRALLEVTFKEEGERCRSTVRRIKFISCEQEKKCQNSTYEVGKCDKTAKSTFLTRTSYINTNGTCLKKIRKLKEVPCKCYKTTNGNIKVTFGKTCEKGYRSRELMIHEERQGKCINVKFTLRSIRCIKRCLKREYRVTKCKDNKREVSKYRETLINGMCSWKLSSKKVLDCKTPCPTPIKKTTRCVLGKQALLEITFKEVGVSCNATVVRLKIMNCKKEKKCQNSTFEVEKCDKNTKTTFLNRIYYVSVDGKCIRKAKKIKEIACKCYENRSRDISVTIGKICEKGYHSRELVLHEERQGQCVDVKFKLRRIKCTLRCLKREYNMTKCKDNKREVSRYQETLINGKCEWKLLDKRVINCKNPCPQTRQKTTRCVLGKQALLQITFKEEAGKCKTTVVRLKLMKCESKKCQKSTYEVAKCEKNAKTTSLSRTYYQNINNTCVKKTMKVRELPCKCYENIKGNLTITLGKTCESGFRSRELILSEDRQGKCVNIKFTLRRIKCERQCGGVRTVPGPCVNQKRIVKSYENVLTNGSCYWKFVRESSVNCTNACPQPKNYETPCVLGKRFLVRKTYQLIGNTCIPRVQKLRGMECKNCTQRSLYKVENCTKGSNNSNLVKISFKDCKQQVEVLRKIDCSCYHLNRNNLKISTASKCNNGTRTRTLYYYDKGKSSCEQKEFTIRGIKCGCYGSSMIMSTCKNGNRTLTFFKKQLLAGKCEEKKLYSRNMRCKTVCPDRMVKKSKCVKNRIFEVSNEYQQTGDVCKVIKYQVKWSNCTITTIVTKECNKKYDLMMSTCIKRNASIIAKRQVKKDNKCVDESRKIAVVDCDGKCERNIRPKLVAGSCEKNQKLIFNVFTNSQNNKCYHKIIFLGRIKCKNC